MTTLSRFIGRLDDLTAEHVLLVIILAISVFFFVESYDFEQSIAMFPRFFSLAVILGTLLLLFRNYLPKGLGLYVNQSVSLVETSAKLDQLTGEEQPAEPSDLPETEKRLSPIQFLAIILGAYAVLGYLIGLLWVTPLLIAGYGYWRGLPRRVILLLSAIGFGAGIAFWGIIGVNIDAGILLG